jgi:hypothetical protein
LGSLFQFSRKPRLSGFFFFSLIFFFSMGLIRFPQPDRWPPKPLSFSFFLLARLVVCFIRPRLRRLHEYQNTEMTRRWVGGNAHGLVWASIYLPHPNDKQRIPYWAVKRRPSWKHFLNRESRGDAEKHLAARWDSTNYHHGMTDIYRIKPNAPWPPFSPCWTFIFLSLFFKALLGSGSIQKVIISRTDA